MLLHSPGIFKFHRLFFLAILVLLPISSSTGSAALNQEVAAENTTRGNPGGQELFLPTTAQSRLAEGQGAEQPIDMISAIERVAEENIPAVVHVEVTERLEVELPVPPFLEDPFFRRFFGGPRTPEKLEQEVQSIGSGMIMDQKGMILTNFHVVSGATQIEVLLADGSRYPAELIGGDSKTDLAVLRIETVAQLPHVVFGDSDQVKVGQWVVAIGHPRGLTQTVTQGIISAKHRTGLVDPSNYQDFLQTDAAINPGNSGGPLLNLRGEVIGVNAGIATTSGGFEGIGFAIPSNMALFVARQLVEQGEVRRGWLGVTIQDLTADLARELKLERPEGALVAGVFASSPADQAGLEEGDVIITYDHRMISDAAILRNEVAVSAIDEEVLLTVWRDGNELEIPVRIGSQERAHEVLVSWAEERLGAEFRPVSPETVAMFGIEQGVELGAVEPGGRLEQLGFGSGDLILAIDDLPAESPESLALILSAVEPGQAVILLALDRETTQIGYIEVILE